MASTTVQVVLMEDLPNVGGSGELVRVKPGFARNFLVPRGLAAMATKDNVKRIQHEKRVAVARAAKRRAEAQHLAANLNGELVEIKAQVGEENRLFGSVTSRDVSDALAKQGFTVDRRKIVMDTIKTLGTHTASVKIAVGVSATIKIDVVSSE